MTFSERLKQARTNKKISQQELSKLVGVHYTNIGRYERGEADPSSNVLNKLAQALDVTPDFLINGTINDKAENTITDNELLIQFKEVEKMEDEDKRTIKKLIDAFIAKRKIQKLIL